jgi:hypothetical protein
MIRRGAPDVQQAKSSQVGRLSSKRSTFCIFYILYFAHCTQLRNGKGDTRRALSSTSQTPVGGDCPCKAPME